jgi:hypothetical protein
LLVIDNGSTTRISGDRMSIGGQLLKTKFTCHKITISKTANYFMYTDGYTDQFGGINDKKFKNAKFIKLLEESYGKETKKHIEKIENTFMNWRGLHERKLTPQTDDVLVVGFSL